MLSSLHNILQKRKGKLSCYLKSNIDILPLEKQHQIYGAIKELDNLTEVLSKHRQKEISSCKKD